jgi:hypothetical protein
MGTIESMKPTKRQLFFAITGGLLSCVTAGCASGPGGIFSEQALQERRLSAAQTPLAQAKAAEAQKRQAMPVAKEQGLPGGIAQRPFAQLDSAQLDSAQLGSAQLGSSRPSSAQTPSPWLPTTGAGQPHQQLLPSHPNQGIIVKATEKATRFLAKPCRSRRKSWILRLLL